MTTSTADLKHNKGDKMCLSNSTLVNNTIHRYRFVPLSKEQKAFEITLISVSAFGVLGNILSFLVMKNSKQSTTTLWLTILALVDLTYLLIIGTMSVFGLFDMAYTGIYLYPLSKGVGLLCIWVVVFVAVERYVAVVHPFKVKSVCTRFRVKLITCITIFLCNAIQIPFYFNFKLIKDTDPQSGHASWSVERMPFSESVYYQLFYQVGLMWFVQLIIPVSILTFTSVAILKVQQKSRSFQANYSTGRNNDSTMMVLVVVLALSVCQLPDLIHYVVNALHIIAPSLSERYSLLRIQPLLRNIEYAALVCNSSINFLIYVMASTRFRAELAKLFRSLLSGPTSSQLQAESQAALELSNTERTNSHI